MKRLQYILTLVLCTLSLGTWSQDYARLGERTIMGTARYVGMSGAMSAIGGDPAAAQDNIAGLGLYRRAEGMLTLDVTHGAQRTSCMLPQASFVLSLPCLAPESKVRFHNLLFSYRRMHSYNRMLYGTAGSTPSLGAMLANTEVEWDIPFCADSRAIENELRLQESGAVHKFMFAWAANISDRWYVGFGLNLHSYTLSADADYREVFKTVNALGVNYYNLNTSSIFYNGFGVGLSGGVLWRPTGWLRLGLGVETPSLGYLNIRTSGTLTAQTDSLRQSFAPDLNGRNRDFHQPMHTSASVAFQIGAYSLIALQYDLHYQPQEKPLHSLRAGLEVIPVLGLYLNAGYAYESTFRQNNTVVPMDPLFERQDTYFIYPKGTQYASFAIGYRGTNIMVQAAYQYRWQRLDMYAHEYAQPYDLRTETHRVVLTIGWHQN